MAQSLSAQQQRQSSFFKAIVHVPSTFSYSQVQFSSSPLETRKSRCTQGVFSFYKSFGSFWQRPLGGLESNSGVCVRIKFSDDVHELQIQKNAALETTLTFTMTKPCRNT